MHGSESGGDPLRDPTRTNALVLAGLVLLCALVWIHAAHPIENPDFGWHVAMGRWMLEHGSIPDAEPFTHTAAGKPMVAYAWLSQWTYAAVIQVAGVTGLRFGNALLAAGLIGLVFAMLRREGVGSTFALLGTVLWMVIAESRFQLRPHMFNMLLFAVAYGSLFVLRPRLTRGQLAGFFALAVLWINLHSGALLFAAIVGLYATVLTCEQWFFRAPADPEEPGEGRIRRLWALAGLVGVAMFVTPNHVRILPYVLESGRINAGLSLEWLSIASDRAFAVHGPLFLWAFWGLTACVVAVAVAALVGSSASKPIPRARLAVVLFVAILPFLGQRFTWTSLVSVVFVFGATAGLVKARPRWLGLAASLAAILLTGAALGRDLDPDRLRARFGAFGNFRPAAFPVGAMTFLEGVALEGNLYSPNAWGGYVLFRTQERYPIFVDGRWVTIGESVIRDAHRIAFRRPGYRELLAAYEIEILLVPRGWMTDEIRSRDGWLPAFENMNSGVYLRPGPSFEDNRTRIGAYYRGLGIPFDPQSGFDERRAAAANPSWARRLRVERLHLTRFRVSPSGGGESEWVAGW